MVKFGIGLGIYPNGILSFKYYRDTTYFIQTTISWSFYYDEYTDENKFGVIIGIRGAYRLAKIGTDYYNYSHLIGIGTGINFKKGKYIPISEFFYEFELFPNPELILSLSPNVGISIVKMKEVIPFGGGGINFYMK